MKERLDETLGRLLEAHGLAGVLEGLAWVLLARAAATVTDAADAFQAQAWVWAARAVATTAAAPAIRAPSWCQLYTQ